MLWAIMGYKSSDNTFWNKSFQVLRWTMCTVTIHWNMITLKSWVQIFFFLVVGVCLFLNLLKLAGSWGKEGRGGGGGHWKAEGGHSSLLWPKLDLTGLVLNWWCWSRRRQRRGALCYLLEALLVPSLPVDTVGGDLPPIGDILANLGPVAVPLSPLAIRLGCSKAHLVLLQGIAQKRITSEWFNSSRSHKEPCRIYLTVA